MKKTKSQTKQEEIELRKNPINVFACQHSDCSKLSAMKAPEFKEHLLNVHNVSPDNMKGKKQMVCHIDGDYWFSSDYQWELDSGLKFQQHVMMAREKPMYL